eukprot:GEMP01009276.1.p1 GENE.GEMP01009276.1~~GEMP01009276.1.p1  ORF type:complete len:467 (+),score=72.06 GEMP01009276.1:66-1466(+)
MYIETPPADASEEKNHAPASTHSPKEFKQIYIGVCLYNRYEIRQLLGEGAYAEIWEAMDLHERKPVAIKMLLRNGTTTKKPLSDQIAELKAEARFHRLISKSVKMVPRYIDFIQDTRYGPYIVMEAMGEDLGAVRNKSKHPHHKMTISCVARLGRAAVDCLRDFHSQGFVHRDLKPQNLLLGRLETKDQLNVFLTDFGFVKMHMDPNTKAVYAPEHRPNFRGTAPYSSLRALSFEDQGRRDDLEALCFLLTELLLGGLPWSVIQQTTDRRERDKKIYEMKTAFMEKAKAMQMENSASFSKQFGNAYCGPYDSRVYELPPEAAPRFLPPELIKFLVYVHGLKYESTPNYQALQRYLADMENTHVVDCNKHFRTGFCEESYIQEALVPLEKILKDNHRDCMDFWMHGICFLRNCKLQHARTAAPDGILNAFRGKRDRTKDGLGDSVTGPPELILRKIKRIRTTSLKPM